MRGAGSGSWLPLSGWGRSGPPGTGVEVFGALATVDDNRQAEAETPLVFGPGGGGDLGRDVPQEDRRQCGAGVGVVGAGGLRHELSLPCRACSLRPARA